MKLGEILVAQRVITEKQLKGALSAQLIYGGHLGTCLIELGCITEEKLGEVLSKISGVDYAPYSVLEDIPPYVIATLPAELAHKLMAVPFRIDGKTLDVAMIDPRNLEILDELRFTTGHRIRPWVAPEIRIFQVLERYYGIPRRLRYITICRQLDEAHRARPAEARSPAATPPAPPPVPEAFRTDPELLKTNGTAADGLAQVSRLLCAAETEDQLTEAILSHAAEGMKRAVLFVVKNGRAVPWKTVGLALAPRVAHRPSFPIVSEPVFMLMREEQYYRGPVPPDDEFRPFFTALVLDVPPEILVLPVYLDDQLVALFYGDGGAEGSIRGATEDYRRLMKKMSGALSMLRFKRVILAS